MLLNVEGAIGTGVAPRKCGPRSTSCFAFRQPAEAAPALRRVSRDSAQVVGNVANNHSHDAGDDGLVQTFARLNSAGVRVTGADTIATAVVTPAGDTIGVLGFYTSADTPDARDVASVRRHVERAAERWPVVIVTMHLGAEGAGAQRTRNATERFLKNRIDRGNPVAFADSAFAGGATMVIGHGPHVLRAAEWRGARLAFYSLGNLLTYGPFQLREPMNRGVVACATIAARDSVRDVTLASTQQLAPGVLVADSTQRAWALIDSLSALDFPATGVTVDASGKVGPREQTVVQEGAPRVSEKQKLRRRKPRRGGAN
ncbi:MAG: Capsule synthesis protein CapA [Gemmatimonadetes bacterium]|nr:Capsule synthesis protein CapA [Gemmatimonadota bacterium]